MTQKPDLKCVGGTAIKVAASPQSSSLGSGLILQSLEKIRTVVSDHLSALMTAVFESIDDSFFDMAERASNSNEQHAYFDTMRALRLQKDAIIAQCVVSWGNQYRQLTAGMSADSGASLISTDELSLMQHDELEENVAIDGIIKKARDQAAHGIYAFHTRVATVLHQEQLSPESNPLDPRAICDAVRNSCRQVDIPIKHKLILFKLFEKQFMSRYLLMLRDANEILIRRGVLPDLKAGHEKKASHTAAEQKDSSDKTPQQAKKTLLDSIQLLLDSVRADGLGGGDFPELPTVLSSSGLFSGNIGSSVPDAKEISVPDLMPILSRLQASQPSDQRYTLGEVLPELNIRHLLNSLLTQQEQRLGPTRVQMRDTNTIDLVAMMFDFILSDENLPSRIKALLGRLQIPVVKVALLDPMLFSSGAHPARRLINELARAGIGLSQRVDVVKDLVFLKISDVVQSLLKNFNDDLNVFQACLDDFMQFMDNEKRRSTIIEQRTRAMEEGKARSEEATSKANKAIVARTGDILLPKVVVTILETAWQQYLYLVYLKHGNTSSEWASALKTVDELVASVSVVESEEQRKVRIASLADLEDALREGFQTVSLNPFEANQLLTQLSEAQHQALSKPEKADVEGGEPTDKLMEALSRDLDNFLVEQKLATDDTISQGRVVAKVTPLALSRRSEPEAKLNLPPLEDEDKDLCRARSMQVGCWLEYVQDAEEKLRCKLAAFIRSVDKMIFVNRSGVKLFEKTTLEFAHDLKAGRVVPLDDSLLFDRALENVIGNLKKIRQHKL